jgi:DNA repair exonuclease SbcCD ATPase subunit
MVSDDSAADPDTVLALDDILKHEVSYATTYASLKNYSALQRSIFEIEELIFDRPHAGDYYKDPEYIKCRLRKNALYAQREELRSHLDEINKRIEQLKTDYENPNLKIPKNSILTEARQLQNEGKKFVEKIKELNVQIKDCEKLLRTYVVQDMSNSNDDGFADIFDEYVAKIGLANIGLGHVNEDDFFFNI